MHGRRVAWRRFPHLTAALAALAGMPAGAHADPAGVVNTLRAEGCEVIDNDEPSEYGKFAWVMDPEGNKVELWEPPAGQ